MKLCLLLWHKGIGVNTGWAKSRYTVIVLNTIYCTPSFGPPCKFGDRSGKDDIWTGQERSKTTIRTKFIIRNMGIHAIHRTVAAGRRNASSIPGGHGVESRLLSDQTGCGVNSASCRVHNDAVAQRQHGTPLASMSYRV